MVQNDYVFDIEDIRTGDIYLLHGSRLKYYHDASIEEKSIMSHVHCSETRMTVARLMNLVKVGKDFKVLVRWKGLTPRDDTLEPPENVFQDVPKMLERLIVRKSTPDNLAREARDALGL